MSAAPSGIFTGRRAEVSAPTPGPAAVVLLSMEELAALVEDAAQRGAARALAAHREQEEAGPTLDSKGACRALGLVKEGKANLPALNSLLTRQAGLRECTRKRGARLIFDRAKLEAWIAEHPRPGRAKGGGADGP